MKPSDNLLLELLQNRPEEGIKEIYEAYYNTICQQIYRIIKERDATEDIAQEVFLQIWKNRDSINIQNSLIAYLRRAARNRTLNYIRDYRSKQTDHEDQLESMKSHEESILQILEAEELNAFVQRQIDALPPRCRLVFSLSRFEHMTYREIAKHMGISVKTVENQMLKALKTLRRAVHEYMNRG